MAGGMPGMGLFRRVGKGWKRPGSHFGSKKKTTGEIRQIIGYSNPNGRNYRFVPSVIEKKATKQGKIWENPQKSPSF